MRFLTGIICGILLTVIAVFLADQATVTSGTEPRGTIVNWDLAAQRLASSLDVVRDEVNDLTRQ